MELEKVKEIVEARSGNECNDFLRLGWILIAVATMNTDSREYSNPQITYSLGWIKEEEPQYPKR